MANKKIDEKEVQKLVADYPWLLNMNYRNVEGLKNKGMEYHFSDGTRADLILVDSITKRPVIVEFKAVPFYRENIGQILEYRSKMVMELNQSESYLYNIFGDLITASVLILVVSECDEYARIACNMQNIEIYEYEKDLAEFIKPGKIVTLDEFADKINKSVLPIDDDRYETVTEIYKEISGIMNDLGCSSYTKPWKRASGEYYYPMQPLFINKYLFEGQNISIGIYEDVIHEEYDHVRFEFFSKDKKALQGFCAKLKKIKRDEYKDLDENYDDEDESFCTLRIDKNKFISNVMMIKSIIEDYMKIMGIKGEN
jgi:hypothetical protein